MLEYFQAVLIRNGSETTVTLRGELDLVAAAAAEEVVTQVLADPDTDVVLDFADLTYLSATGVTPLVRLSVALEGTGRRLTARNASRTVALVLTFTPIEVEDEPMSEVVATA